MTSTINYHWASETRFLSETEFSLLATRTSELYDGTRTLGAAFNSAVAELFGSEGLPTTPRAS